MTIRIELEKDLNNWDDLTSKGRASPFHSSRFVEALRVKGVEPIYLKIHDDEKIIGGVSGVVEKSRYKLIERFNQFKTAVFFSGPFFLMEYSNKDASEGIVRYLRKNGFVNFRYMGYDTSCMLELGDKSFESKVNDEWIINLDGGRESFKKGLRRRIRQKVRKANKENLKFNISDDPDLVDVLDNLLDETAEFRSRRNLDEFKKYYMRFMDKQVMAEQISNGIGHLAYVSRDDEIFSMAYYIFENFRSFLIFIGTSETGYDNGANAKLLHDTTETLIDQGCNLFNLGSTRDGPGKEGLIFFKKGLGAQYSETWTMVSPFLRGNILKYMTDINKLFKKRFIRN